MERLLLLLSFCVMTVLVRSQSLFQKTYTPHLLGIEQEVLPNEDLIVSGTISLTNYQGIGLIRFNSCGHPVWSYQISHPSKSIQLIDMKIDQDQNILIAGNYFIKSGERNAFIASLSSNGALNYFKVFDTGTADILYSMDLNQTGEILIFFKTNIGQAGPHSNNTIAKMNAGGEVQWIKEYGFTGRWGQMCASADGGSLISDANQIVKLDASGNVEWQKQFENSLYSENHFETDHGYVFFRYSISGSNYSYPLMLDKKGNLKWNGQNIPLFFSFRGIQRKNGNLLFVGDFALSATQNSPALIEIDSANGEILRTSVHFNNLPLAIPNDLSELSDSSLIYAGSESLSFSGGLFLSRVNDSLARLACSDSLLDLNYPRNTDIIQNATSWNSSSVNISIIEPNISIDVLSMSQGQVLCLFNPLELDLGKDTTICQGERIELTAPTSFEGYQWSTADTSPSITVDQPGTYALKTWTNCDTITDTIQISLHPMTKLDFEYSPIEPKVLDSVSFTLHSPEKYQSLLWDFGDGLSSAKNPSIHQYKNSGSQFPKITLIDSLGCQISNPFQINLEPLSYRIPNVFTPNGDGINEEFKVIGEGIESMEITIFNRWGKMVFESSFASWDGKSTNGSTLPEGNYFYRIRFKQFGIDEKIINGTVTLLLRSKSEE